MSNLIETKFQHRTSAGRLIASPVVMQYDNGRIIFRKSPFALKDEIKAMTGSRWHPKDAEDDEPRNCWSVEDCNRNRFQLAYLQGENVYEWFDRDLIQQTYIAYKDGVLTPPMPHQCHMADCGLTYHYQLWAAEMGVGKTLSAQLVIEKSGANLWWWAGPKTSLPNIRREFKRWGFRSDSATVEMMTYEELVRRMDEWKPGDPIPQGFIGDESSRLKGASSQRTRAAQMLADLIREKYGYDGYTILMSGTPSPKTPVDWWSQCEIVWPGFLKEGSPRALEARLAFLVDQEFDTGVFKRRKGWKDNEEKCAVCGELYDEGPHELDGFTDPDDYHKYVQSKNEVAHMFERLQGLVVIKHKKDCLNLPEKRYRQVICKPTSSTLRVAQALMQAAPNTITGLTHLRELSDGFLYKEVKDGKKPCTHCPDSKGKVFEWFGPDHEEGIRDEQSLQALGAEIADKLERREVDCPRCKGKGEIDNMVRVSREVPCPKDKALKADLERCEETGRVVIFAGFTGSIDRISNLCRKEGWAVLRIDGRGFEVTTIENGELRVICTGGDEALAYWADMSNPRVAVVAHPESGGMSLTLVESRMAIFYSNSFKPEYRSQAEDRIHRKGMDENLGCEIVDYFHLPTDLRVFSVIRENRKLELMTMGEFTEVLETADTAESESDADLIVQEIAG